jgi:hypothetical protein
MLLPFRREALNARSELDELAELAEARQESPAERLALSIELSDLTCELAESAGAEWRESPVDLEDKSRLYVWPLKAAAGTG